MILGQYANTRMSRSAICLDWLLNQPPRKHPRPEDHHSAPVEVRAVRLPRRLVGPSGRPSDGWELVGAPHSAAIGKGAGPQTLRPECLLFPAGTREGVAEPGPAVP